MLDGHPLVDVHLHPAKRSTVKLAWEEWAPDFGAGERVRRMAEAVLLTCWPPGPLAQKISLR